MTGFMSSSPSGCKCPKGAKETSLQAEIGKSKSDLAAPELWNSGLKGCRGEEPEEIIFPSRHSGNNWPEHSEPTASAQPLPQQHLRSPPWGDDDDEG